MKSKWNILVLLGILTLIAAPAAASPPTPFLISGWVNDSHGHPVNDPNVVIINTSTGDEFALETNVSSNYYQAMTSSYNVSAGSVLGFSVNGGTATNHEVTEGEIGAGGFEQNLTVPIQIAGDVNGDGYLTAADAAIVLRMAVRGECSEVADVSGDGAVTSLDALMILQAAQKTQVRVNETEWPMFHHDLRHTGCTPATGNASVKDYELVWSYTTGDKVLSSPVIADLDRDGCMETIVGSYDGKLYVFNSTGELKWNHTTGAIHSTPAIDDIDRDGELDIVVGSMSGNLYAIDAEGNVKWNNTNESWIGMKSSPAIADIDKDGDMEIVACSSGYAGSSPAIHVLNSIGEEEWQYPLEDRLVLLLSSPAIADIDKDGGMEIVVGSSDGLYAVNSEGIEEWNYTSISWPIYGLDSSPTIADIDDDGEIEIVIGSECPFDCYLNEGKLLVFNSTGYLEWNFTGGYSVFSSPAVADIDGDGEIELIFGSRWYNESNPMDVYGVLYVLNSSGQVEWRYQTTDSIESSPAIADLDGDGKMEIIIGSDDGKLYIFNSTGHLEWSYQTGGAVSSSPAIADINNDGNLEIVVGSEDGKIYAFGGDVWSEDIRITNDPALSMRPTIAVDLNDNVHIVWEDYRDGSREIYYTKLDEDGNKLIDDKRLSIDLGFDPTIAIDSNNNVHIAWWEGFRIYYTKLDSNGTTLVYKILTDFGPPMPTIVDIAADSKDNIYITWGSCFWSTGINYTKLDSNGTTLVDDVRLTSRGSAPRVAVDSDNNVHITWWDYCYINDTYTYEIYYMKLDSNGTTLIDDKRLITSDSASAPKIAVDLNNNVHMTWWDFTFAWWDFFCPETLYSEHIHYMKLDSNGCLLVNDTKLSTGIYPAIAVDSDNNVHITWDDNRDGNDEIYYTKLDSDGNTLIDGTRLTYNSADSNLPSIAVDSKNKTHITWCDWRDGNPEIYYKRQR